MNPTWLEPAATRDFLKVRVLWVALALSLAFHAAVLWQWRLSPSSDRAAAMADTQGRMRVRLAPASIPQSASPASVPRQAAPKAPAQARKPVPAAPPPVIALSRPGPANTVSPVPEAAAPVPQVAAPAPDLASMIEARRRARAAAEPARPDAWPTARAESTPEAGSVSSTSTLSPADEESARAERAVAANLGALRAPARGESPNNAGGIFRIRHMGITEAEFAFFGWNKEMGRRTPQLIEVRKGDNADIRIAVVRRMIVIIREHKQDDFVWESLRLGRNLTLSAREKDNVRLEEFLLREFFG